MRITVATFVPLCVNKMAGNKDPLAAAVKASQRPVAPVPSSAVFAAVSVPGVPLLMTETNCGELDMDFPQFNKKAAHGRLGLYGNIQV
jgi:hypothetical protein